MKTWRRLAVSLGLSAVMSGCGVTDSALEEVTKVAADVEGVVRSASKELPRYQGRTVDEWRGQLQDRSQTYRLQAMDALAHLGPDARSAVPDLRPGLDDRDFLIRMNTVLALMRIDPDGSREDCLRVLIDGLRRDKTALVAAQAVSALGPLAAAATPALLKRAQQESVTGPFTSALNKMGATAVKVITEDLQSGPVEARRSDISKLSEFGASAVPGYRVALKDTDPWVRYKALRGLEQLGPEAKDAIQDVLAVIRSLEEVPGDQQDFYLRSGLPSPMVQARRTLRAIQGDQKESQYPKLIVGRWENAASKETREFAEPDPSLVSPVGELVITKGDGQRQTFSYRVSDDALVIWPKYRTALHSVTRNIVSLSDTEMNLLGPSGEQINYKRIK